MSHHRRRRREPNLSSPPLNSEFGMAQLRNFPASNFLLKLLVAKI